MWRAEIAARIKEGRVEIAPPAASYESMLRTCEAAHALAAAVNVRVARDEDADRVDNCARVFLDMTRVYACAFAFTIEPIC